MRQVSWAMRPVIEAAYRVFPVNRFLPRHLDVCTHCCMLWDYHEALRSTPRREISAVLIYEYNTAAKCAEPQAVIDEIKHFLPRMLELCAEQEDIGHCLSYNFVRYAKLGAPYWTAPQLRVLNDFAAVYHRDWLRSGAKGADVIEVWAMLNALPIHVEALFETWLRYSRATQMQDVCDVLLVRFSRVTCRFSGEEDDRALGWRFAVWLDQKGKIGVLQRHIEDIIMLKPERWFLELEYLYDWLETWRLPN